MGEGIRVRDANINMY